MSSEYLEHDPIIVCSDRGKIRFININSMKDEIVPFHISVDTIYAHGFFMLDSRTIINGKYVQDLYTGKILQIIEGKLMKTSMVKNATEMLDFNSDQQMYYDQNTTDHINYILCYHEKKSIIYRYDITQRKLIDINFRYVKNEEIFNFTTLGTYHCFGWDFGAEKCYIYDLRIDKDNKLVKEIETKDIIHLDVFNNDIIITDRVENDVHIDIYNLETKNIDLKKKIIFKNEEVLDISNYHIVLKHNKYKGEYLMFFQSLREDKEIIIKYYDTKLSKFILVKEDLNYFSDLMYLGDYKFIYQTNKDKEPFAIFDFLTGSIHYIARNQDAIRLISKRKCSTGPYILDLDSFEKKKIPGNGSYIQNINNNKIIEMQKTVNYVKSIVPFKLDIQIKKMRDKVVNLLDSNFININIKKIIANFI